MQNATAAQAINHEAVVEIINAGTTNLRDNLSGVLHSAMHRQQNVMVLCSCVPLAVMAYIYFVKNPAIHQASTAVIANAVEKLPSKEYVVEIVKSELANRAPVVKPAVITISAQQLIVVGGTGMLVGGLLVIICFQLQKNKSKDLRLN